MLCDHGDARSLRTFNHAVSYGIVVASTMQELGGFSGLHFSSGSTFVKSKELFPGRVDRYFDDVVLERPADEIADTLDISASFVNSNRKYASVKNGQA
jgi:hypothetical protein